MISPLVAQLIADERSAELQRSATTTRLAAIARCCQPSAWARTARRAAQSVIRLRAVLRRDRVGTAVCCADA